MKIVEIIAGPRAPLYHGTDIINMARIVVEGVLYEGAHWGRPGEPHGIRFTRDPRMAWGFGESEVDMPTVLVFDQSKLIQRYRIVPYRDVDAGGQKWTSNEMEEVLLAEQLPIAPFLLGLLLNPAHIKAARIPEWADYAIQERGFKSRRAYYGALDKLARHPLTRSGQR